MTKMRLLASLLGLGAFVACGPATPESTMPVGVSAPPTAPPPEAPAPATSAAAAATPALPQAAVGTVWRADFTVEQQMAFMKANVVPHMGPVFQAANAKRYANFGCQTCHGPNGKPPPEFLPHLTLQNGKMTCFVQSPDLAKFMASRVVPEMAASLGEAPFDPATKTGFGCAGCHVVDVK